MFIQQGDIIIERVEELPKGLKKLDHGILEEGETPGHYHQFDGYSPTDVAVYEDENKNKFFHNFNAITIKHEEHAPVEIPRGIYRIRKVREFNHLNQAPAPRDVVD